MRARSPRRSRAARLLALTSLAIVAATCSDGASPPIPTGRIRFVNLIADGQSQPVDVFLDGARFGTSLPFGASSPLWLPPPFTAIYARIPMGEHELFVRKSSDSLPVAVYDFDLAEGEDRTLYATGGGGLFAQQTVDDNTAPEPGTIRLRVVNLSFAAGPVDLFITAQTADLAAATPAMTGTSTGSASEYFNVVPGAWRVRAVRSGAAAANRTSNVVANVNEQLWERGARTILIADITGGFGTVSTAVILSDQ